MDRHGDMGSGAFDARCELMLDVTWQTLRSDPELKLCEGLRLIEATRVAISRLAPESAEFFERQVLPQMRSALMERFGVTISSCPGVFRVVLTPERPNEREANNESWQFSIRHHSLLWRLKHNPPLFL